MTDEAFPLVDCPACQRRTLTVQGVRCPWCLDGQVSIEVAAAYWRVRAATPYEFHAVFGARVPIDRAKAKKEAA